MITHEHMFDLCDIIYINKRGGKNLNLTFFIGNGFDIRNGLPTRYSDFYKEINNKSGNMIYKDIESNKENWSDFELGLGKLTISKKVNTDIEEFIESYNEVLDDLDKYIKKCEDMISVVDAVKLNNSFLNDITKVFQNLKQTEKNRIQILMGLGAGININFIDFNYTSLLDKCIGNKHNFRKDDKNYYLKTNVHIHGTVDSYPIVGVDNRNQINESWLGYHAIENMLKPEIIKKIGYGAYDKTKEIIEKSDVIYIFGSSLGDTDRTWWIQILNWLHASSERALVIDQYGFNEEEKINAVRYISEKEKIKDNFVKYASTERDINRVYNQIFITNNDKLFDFSEYITKKNK